MLWPLLMVLFACYEICQLTTQTENVGVIPPTRSNVMILPGLFNRTLEPFLSSHAPLNKISFVNIDMDLYSGAYYVLNTILPHLSIGAVIHFHDFFNSIHYCRPSDEMQALYDVMFGRHNTLEQSERNIIQLQMMPFETGGFRQPIVFRVL